jgi:hypothetical protein
MVKAELGLERLIEITAAATIGINFSCIETLRIGHLVTASLLNAS